MKPDELRAVQAPLKEKFRNDPSAALYTLNAEGTIGDNVSCNVKTGLGIAKAGLHPATGGSGNEICSGDMLLQALAACAGVTLSAVATNMGIEIRQGKVSVSGELDFRGTLGVAKDAAVGFKSISVKFDLDTNADEKQLESLLKLTERYCVVYQTLTTPPATSSEIIITVG